MKKIVSIIGVIAILFTMQTVISANEFVIMNNGEQLIFTNGILLEDDMLYLPLEELLNKLGITENPDNYLNTEGNKFSLYIEGGSNEDIYNMEINKKEIHYTQSPETYASAARETEYAPVLRNGLIYIPFEYVDYIFNTPFEGIYHIECLNSQSENIIREDNTKIDDGAVSIEVPGEIPCVVWVIGGAVAIFVIAFVVGYKVCKKSRRERI